MPAYMAYWPQNQLQEAQKAGNTGPVKGLRFDAKGNVLSPRLCAAWRLAPGMLAASEALFEREPSAAVEAGV